MRPEGEALPTDTERADQSAKKRSALLEKEKYDDCD